MVRSGTFSPPTAEAPIGVPARPPSRPAWTRETTATGLGALVLTVAVLNVLISAYSSLARPDPRPGSARTLAWMGVFLGLASMASLVRFAHGRQVRPSGFVAGIGIGLLFGIWFSAALGDSFGPFGGLGIVLIEI